MRLKARPFTIALPAVLSACMCALSGMGQGLLRQQTPPSAPIAKPPAGESALPAAAPVAPSLFQQPPQPAQVKLAPGTLSVDADNSSLDAILQQVSASTGMQVQGLAQDQRIFGKYGPGQPREVISALLEGSGYNVVMLGQTTSGAPRQLTLSSRSNASLAPQPPPHPAQEEDADGPPPVRFYQPPPGAEQRPPMRTPQQMLEELQRLRQQQPPSD
jgi:hypothetical protein